MDFKYPIITRYIQPESAKIPRPANAFMLYANHNRKRVAQLYPLESNKEISKRLGTSWKELDSVEKLKYYDLAKKVDAEHKKKYPDYVYNPKEARIRKAMREASRERAMGIAPMTSPRGGIRRGVAGSNSWNFPAEDQMMMTSHGMRMIGSPMCTSPGFTSVQSAPNSGFMPPLHYAKHVHPMGHHPTSSFVQNNAIPRLPPQDIWHPYDEMRSSSTGPYIIPPPHQMHSYQPQLETFRPKPKMDVDVFPSTQEHQNMPSNCESQQKLPLSEPVFENKLDSIQPLETENVENEPYLPAPFNEGNFDSKEETKPKKVQDTLNLSVPPSDSLKFQPTSLCRNKEYSKKSSMERVENVMVSPALCGYAYYPEMPPYVTSGDYSFMNPADVNDILLMENYSPTFSSYQGEGEVLNLSIHRRNE